MGWDEKKKEVFSCVAAIFLGRGLMRRIISYG